MRLRHDAVLEVTTTDRNGTSVSRVRADLLDAHLTVRAAMAGHVSGMTGPGRAPKVNIRAISGELFGDELCECVKCEQEGTEER